MQQQVDTIRQEITNPNGKYTNKDLVTKRKELDPCDDYQKARTKYKYNREKGDLNK